MKIKNKIYFLVLFFIILFLVSIIFIIIPLFFDIKEKSVDLINRKNNIYYNTNQNIFFEDFIKNKKDYDANLNKLNSALIDINNPVVFIKFIEEISKENGLIFNIVSTQIVDIKNDNLKYLYLKISFLGNIKNALSLINKIESAPYFISIQDLRISKKIEDKNEKEQNIIQLDLIMKVYGK